MRKTALIFAFTLAAAGPAMAQAPASQPASSAITAGMEVKDTEGGLVGTVQSVDDAIVVVKTDRHEVQLPINSFTPSEGHLLFGMTQAQLNAEVDKANAAAAAQIVEGAEVRGSAGAVVGTIEKLEPEFVTLKLTSGELVRLPRSGVGAGPTGPIIGMTQDQLKAAIGS